MNYFALFFFVLSTLSASTTPPTVRRYKSSREAFEGPDRTITWRAWKEASGGEFRVRTGDRYLGGQVWEHYLRSEERRVGKECRYQCDWSSDVCSSDLDRTITWRAWKEASGGEFRVRTGDRYLGGQVWEHYLGFELYRASAKPIKLSMISLESEAIPEEVVIRPGLRYAIVKVTNDTMTAHKGMWSWTAQEV